MKFKPGDLVIKNTGGNKMRIISYTSEGVECAWFTEKYHEKTFLEEDLVQEGCTKIIFGDGNIGTPPVKSDTIHIEYLETAGTAANGEYLAVLPEVSSFYFSESLKKKYNFKFDKNNFDKKSRNKYVMGCSIYGN